MRLYDKDSFLLLLKLRPQWLIGRQIAYGQQTAKIRDISLSGDDLYIERSSETAEWVLASSLGDSVVIDINDFPKEMWDSKPFTALSITQSIETLEKLVGQPDSETSKSLFEIVAALKKEILELRLKIDEMELKEKNDEPT